MPPILSELFFTPSAELPVTGPGLAARAPNAPMGFVLGLLPGPTVLASVACCCSGIAVMACAGFSVPNFVMGGEWGSSAHVLARTRTLFLYYAEGSVAITSMANWLYGDLELGQLVCSASTLLAISFPTGGKNRRDGGQIGVAEHALHATWRRIRPSASSFHAHRSHIATRFAPNQRIIFGFHNGSKCVRAASVDSSRQFSNVENRDPGRPIRSRLAPPGAAAATGDDERRQEVVRRRRHLLAKDFFYDIGDLAGRLTEIARTPFASPAQSVQAIHYVSDHTKRSVR